MKKSNFTFQTVLVIISLIAGIVIMLPDGTIENGNDAWIPCAAWWFVFGLLQVLHSFILGFAYWKQAAIRKALLIYWAVTALDLIVMAVNDETINNNNVEFATIVIFPALISFGLWFITFHFKTRPVTIGAVESPPG